MLRVFQSGKFKKDLIKMSKRGCDLNKIKSVMLKIIEQKPLESKHKLHQLKGNFKDRWDCHVDPDWVLIYKIEGDSVIFERTGTHSDLFN